MVIAGAVVVAMAAMGHGNSDYDVVERDWECRR